MTELKRDAVRGRVKAFWQLIASYEQPITQTGWSSLLFTHRLAIRQFLGSWDEFTERDDTDGSDRD